MAKSNKSNRRIRKEVVCQFEKENIRKMKKKNLVENKHGKGNEGNIWRGKYLLAHEMEKERNMFRRKTFLCGREGEYRRNGREIFR